MASRFQDRWFISDEKQAKFMAHIAETKDTLLMVAENKATGQPFGVYTLQRIDHRNRRAGHRGVSGRGAGAKRPAPLEGACLLFTYAFGYLNLHKLCGEVLADNTRALRYNEALGFTVEGTLKEHVFYDGAPPGLGAHRAVRIGFRGDADGQTGEGLGRVRAYTVSLMLLPVHAIAPQIVATLQSGNRLVLTAPTGSGKSTQVPQIVWQAQLEGQFPVVFIPDGEIIVLELRRLATCMVARRVAQ